MTERLAKTQLQRMLGTLTAGSVLHLLAEVFREHAEAARRDDAERTAERCDLVESALLVVGFGIDAACPR